jgi:hypothetical protein
MSTAQTVGQEVPFKQTEIHLIFGRPAPGLGRRAGIFHSFIQSPDWRASRMVDLVEYR